MINLEILVGTALEKQLDLAIDLLRDSGRDCPREAIGPGYRLIYEILVRGQPCEIL